MSHFITKKGDIQPLLQEISELIQQSRQTLHRQVNTVMVQSYWHIGRLIVEHEQQGKRRAAYGKQQLSYLSKQLIAQFGKGFDVSNLRRMRSFYQAFPIQDTVCPELSWSHYRKLIAIEHKQARQWYMQEAVAQHWSVRALDRQISMLYYERLLSSQNKEAVTKEAEVKTAALATSNQDYLRDPYILDFLNVSSQPLLESDMEQGIINNLQQFLLELGKGFAFVERQQRISCDEQDFYLDLIFYNFKLKCFLLIDLKLGKLTHQDIGQMDTYVRIYDQHKKDASDNPTIGLILCSQKSEALAKYSVLADSQQLFASKYLHYLPSEEELQQELQQERLKVQAQLMQQAEQRYDAKDEKP